MEENWLENIKQKSEERYQQRMLRRKELREKNVDAETQVVAWIDILGFSHELEAAESAESFQVAYQKLLEVHDIFDLTTASDDPEETKELNKNYGRTIIALSDGLVIAANPNCEATKYMPQYDFLRGFIYDLVMAQARCALKGIFLRGGISVGPFHYENNMLLSPALVRAYRYESNWAVNPVIIIQEEKKSSEAYLLSYPRTYKNKHKHFYHLDYLDFIADTETHGFYCDEDRKNWSDRVNNTPDERDKIIRDSYIKSAVAAMVQHKEQVLKAHKATTSQSARSKYRWLMDYQNRKLEGYIEPYQVAQFSDKEIAAHS
ncbi:MAG: hypothetical protein ACSHX8_04970 [Opitutaceae bacterium]